MSLTFLNVIHCIIAVFLTGVVLLQPGKGGGLVMGGGTSQSLFGASGGGNFLSKVTAVLGILFVITSITITRMNSTSSDKSIFDSSSTEVTTEVNQKPAAEAPNAANPDAAAGSAASDSEGAAETAPSTDTNSAPATKND